MAFAGNEESGSKCGGCGTGARMRKCLHIVKVQCFTADFVLRSRWLRTSASYHKTKYLELRISNMKYRYRGSLKKSSDSH
jgi:hypothetical protein